ncbi:MAG TPA: DUF819 family protein [Steroidobacteraceae bacterium]|nr:DUF819 family protein [Steroidobacteraceae bacterium]
MSLIESNDVLAITAVLVCLTWLGFAADASRLGKAIPGVVVILVCGSILSNLRITPFSSSAADFVGQYLVAAAIPLLMIKSDLKKIFVESGRVLLGFGAACIGIVCGALLGYFVLQPWHVSGNVAGFYAGAFIGGTISMIAVGNAVQMTANEISVATGASMIPSVLGLMALVALPNLKIVQRLLPRRREPDPTTTATSASVQAATAVPEFRLTHITGALALTFSICALSRLLETLVARLIGHEQSQYNILYVTALTVIIANVFPKQLGRLRGEFELGMIFMYMFFAIIGLGTNVTSFLEHAVSLFFYVILILATGIIVTLLLSRLMKLDLSEAITGCGAAIVGPAATVAVVAGKGWHSMVSPAVMTGIFCHLVGNVIGIAVATALN